MRAQDILGAFGPFAAKDPRYEFRASQLEMADAVERALADDQIALIEAGTGTGKTLAYLIPALLSGKRVVISTGTKALQDQIMRKDIPLIEGVLEMDVSACLMKGLGNYLCLRRYHEFLGSAAAVEGRLVPLVTRLQRWAESTGTGDESELRDLLEEGSLWSHVHSGPDTRIGPRCNYYDECFVTRMRKAAENAQIVVVNHHLFFADLALRAERAAASVIPDYEAVIFDEAHQIEDVATHFFGIEVSTLRIEKLVRDSEAALVDRPVHIPSVVAKAADFFASLPRQSAFDIGRSPLLQEQFTGAVQDALFAFDNALDGLENHCRANAHLSDDVLALARRTKSMRSDLATIVSGPSHSHITWMQTRGRRVSIGASPVDVSGILRDHVLLTSKAVVFTSATLSTSGTFDFIKQRLGIDFQPIEFALPSPFDYEKQAALYLPSDVPDPRDVNFLACAEKEIVELVNLTGGGAFILCTSIRVMNDLARRCKPKLAAKWPVFVQGEASATTLLERFREHGHAVLFATATFWEGVDVPGDSLRLVIIDKLPFDVPSDPLLQARCARLKEQGLEPFMKYVVPSAALSLKQGFGRLIRAKTDHGIVAILDSRLSKKGYGKVLLRSLPPARRVSSFEELRAFWDESRKSQDEATGTASTAVP